MAINFINFQNGAYIYITNSANAKKNIIQKTFVFFKLIDSMYANDIKILGSISKKTVILFKLASKLQAKLMKSWFTA